MAIALAFSTFQLIVAAFHPLSSLVIRSLHVGFLLAMTFLLYPSFRQAHKLSRVPSARLAARRRRLRAVHLPLDLRGGTDPAFGRPEHP